MNPMEEPATRQTNKKRSLAKKLLMTMLAVFVGMFLIVALAIPVSINERPDGRRGAAVPAF